ncbi:MAG: DNA polymerase III subunit delta [bacterium]
MRFLICGSDTFRSRRKLAQIRERFRETRDPSGLNLATFRADKDSIDDLIGAMLTFPLLGQRKMVVAEGFLGLGDLEQVRIADALNRQPESTVAVFFEADDLSSLRPTPPLALLREEKFTEEFKVPTGDTLTSLIVSECERHGIRIEVGACNELARSVGSDSWSIFNEVSKVCALAQSKGQQIVTTPLVREVVAVSQEESIFAFLDDCFDGRTARAVPTLNRLISGGVNELQIMAMLQRQLRLLIGIKNQLDHGIGDRYVIARELGAHPFPVGKAMRTAQRLGMSDMRSAFGNLIEIENRIKSGLARPLTELTLFAVGASGRKS